MYQYSNGLLKNHLASIGQHFHYMGFSNEEIISLLDNKKFTTSNPVTFSRLQQLILNKKLTGYALLFDITDGNSELKNF